MHNLCSSLDRILASKPLGLALSIIVALTLITYGFQMLAYEEFHFVEFEIASFAMLWARGAQLYQDISTEIAPVGFYTPLSYLIPATLGYGLRTADSPLQFLRTFRMAVFAYLLGSLFLVYLLVQRIGHHRNLPLLAVLVLLSPPWCTISARPDWQAFFYTCVALSILARRPQPSNALCVLLGITQATAFLHYQKYISLFLASILSMCFLKRIRQALILTTAFASMMAAVLIPLSILTKGRLLIHSFVVPYLTFLPAEDFFLRPFKGGAGIPLCLLLLMAGYVCVTFILRARRRPLDVFLGIYSLLCIVVGLAAFRSKGASSNHLLEPVLALSLCIAAFIGYHVNLWNQKSAHRLEQRNRRMAILFMTALLWFPAHQGFQVLRYWRAEWLGIRGRYDQTVRYERELRRLERGPLMTDEPAIAYKTNHPEAANESWYYTDVFLPEGLFDPRPTAAKINRRHYASIVLRGDSSLYVLFKDAIDHHYRLTEKFGIYQVWEPLPSGG